MFLSYRFYISFIGFSTANPLSRCSFQGFFRDSVRVDTAETDLQRVLRGAASSFWHARWKHKHWVEYLRFSPSCSAAVAAGKTQVDVCTSGPLSFPAGPPGSRQPLSGSRYPLTSTIMQYGRFGIRIRARFYGFCGAAKQN